MEDNVIKRFGIADCYGIESYEEADSDLFEIRAMANKHRHAVHFGIEISEAVDKEVKDLMAKDDMAGALNLLKKKGKVDLKHTNDKSSWKLIPNKELDPWKHTFYHPRIKGRF